jgi:hypothetical protein
MVSEIGEVSDLPLSFFSGLNPLFSFAERARAREGPLE